jgi:hypothetical protein
MYWLTTSQCIDELRDQAAASLRNKFTEVMEANAAVYISDGVVSLEIRNALRSGVALLESVPDKPKDWHPGSDGKVLDIVHPSLYPLMYGKSKYLPFDKVPLQDCSAYTGQGDTVPTLSLSADEIDYSAKHQWLPCEVSIGTNGEARITSHINNLHPDGNEALYAAVEQTISKAIPLWKATVRSTLYRYKQPRVIVEGDGYDHEAAKRKRENIGKSDGKRRKRTEHLTTELRMQEKQHREPTLAMARTTTMVRTTTMTTTTTTRTNTSKSVIRANTSRFQSLAYMSLVRGSRWMKLPPAFNRCFRATICKSS